MKQISLAQIKKALKNIDRKKRACRKDKTRRLFHNINKKYRQLDWSKDKFRKSDLQGFVQNTALPVFRKMRNYKWVRCFHESNNLTESYYKKSNIENLFLLQQIMCQMDDDYWNNIPKTKKPLKYVPFHFESIYLGKCYICSYPKTLEWKAPLLTQFLQDKQYIFDERTPYGRPLKDLRQFIGKTLMKSKVEKWDYYFQRFLAKKD